MKDMYRKEYFRFSPTHRTDYYFVSPKDFYKSKSVYLGFYIHSENIHIDSIFVQDQYRTQGYARKMLHPLFEVYRTAGLDVFIDNNINHSFWNKIARDYPDIHFISD